MSVCYRGRFLPRPARHLTPAQRNRGRYPAGSLSDDLETLLAHHDEHGWEEPDEEAHVLRRLLEARHQLARLKGERYTPDAELLERLREVERERGNNDSSP
jgi:hypothetical protein